MNNQDNIELIEVVLGLLEKSKQQDESIQKAIKALESEKTALETQIKRIGGVTAQLQQAKKDLDWRNNLWYFGGFAVFIACCFGFMLWFVPSFDEIGERKAELEHLEQQISRMQGVKNLDISTCSGKTCVKVDVNQCNYGEKGQQHCIVK